MRSVWNEILHNSADSFCSDCGIGAAARPSQFAELLVEMRRSTSRMLACNEAQASEASYE